MCVIKKPEISTSVHSVLNMTLAERLPSQNACVEVRVPLGGWSSTVACCPNCRQKLRVSLTAATHKPSIPSPHTPPPFFQPILPHLQLYSNHTQIPRHIPQYPAHNNTDEISRLADTLKALGLCGWYYGNLDWQGARTLLKDASVGAFLIRNSGDDKFIFSLSVQTERGPTSVRLHYKDGFFRLDCDTPFEMYMPRFRSAVDLVQNYARLGERGAAGTVWVDREGCPHSPVLLRTPLRKSPPSLLHVARLAIHRAIDSNPLRPKLWCAPKHRHLPLPSTLIDYLGEYPYSI